MMTLISIFEPNHIVGPVIDLFLIILLELTNKVLIKIELWPSVQESQKGQMRGEIFKAPQSLNLSQEWHKLKIR